MSLISKILKWGGAVVAVLLLIILLLVGGIIVSVNFYSPPDPYKYAEYWPENLTENQADSIAVELISQMSFEEKLEQMTGDASMLDLVRFAASYYIYDQLIMLGSGENERLNIPPFSFSDGPRGVVVTEATAFPVAIARGASWDRDLEYLVGDAIGKEMRAFGGSYFAGVCINLLRHPAWGRAQETFGEDPWHLGKMGVSLINGVQQHHVMACAKHFALNSIEESRFKVSVDVDERTLREVYLPHFKMAVQEADVASVMSAYNRVRGEFAGHNEYLLSEILRNDWNFDGFVSSDWFFGLRDGVKGVNAGMDVEMPFAQYYIPEALYPALEAGEISMDQIDEMVRRIVRTKLIYVTRTDSQEYSEQLLASDEHQQLALEVAEKSMVLLKNDENFLPLNHVEIETLAVIGPLADEDNTGDHGSSMTNPPYVTTILEGIEQFGEGRFQVLFDDGTDFESAKETAEEADVVLVVAGYAHNDEGEFLDPEAEDQDPWGNGGDRPTIHLKPSDLELLSQVLPENDNSAVILVGGSGIMTNDWDSLTKSILMAWYPGMRGGEAIANILFGEANPSGKMPMTVPTDEAHLPFFQADIDSIEYDYYHGYTLLDKEGIEPAYPFGFGLSYTDFEFSNLTFESSQIGIEDTLNVSVDISNIGEVTGEEVVQLYVGFSNSAVDRPVKLLRGFVKNELSPGETKTVTLPVAAQDLAWFNPDTMDWEIELMEYELFVGSSSADRDLLQSSFTIND